MPRIVTRKRVSPQASPQVLSTRRKVTVTRAASKKPPSVRGTPQKETNINTSGQKLTRKSKRIVLTKQASSSHKADASIAQENKKKSLSPRTILTDNKTSVKSKRGVTSSSLSKSKNASNIKRRNTKRTANKNVSTLRQISLKESFTNQAASKQLRSRKVVKNVDDEKLIEKYISPNRQSSSVLVKRVSIKSKAKVPVYKSVALEDTANNESEVYEFKFDVNDSKENVARKKRKRPVKRNVVRKIQRAAVKQKAASENVLPAVPPTKKADKKSVRIVEDKPLEQSLTEEVLAENLVGNLVEQVETDEEKLESPQPVSETAVTDNPASQPVQKPTVVSRENLSNVKVTIRKDTSVSNSDGFMPFRPTNIFNNKSLLHEKSMENSSLFEKSLSPIMKSSAHFDPGSPWRPPPLFTFSQVKSMFQSTPQNNKFDISYGRFVRGSKNESKNIISTPKVLQKKSENIENILQNKNENVPVGKPLTGIHSKKKNPITQRRFGTEITNLDHSAQGNNPLEDISERMVIEPKALPPAAPSVSAAANTTAITIKNATLDAAANIPANTTPDDVPNFDEAEDKENIALNYQTPKKSSKKGLKKSSHRSPFKSTENMENERPKEILEPVPGPSGLQNLKLLKEDRILRQSNLNNFLNLAEIPQSTTIKTRHGIFDDPNSPPISGKPFAKKPEDPESEIKTAFGFGEDDSNENTTSSEDKSLTKDVDIVKEKKRVPFQTITQTQNIKPFVPARLSIGEIRNNLLVKNAKRKAKGNVELENEKGAENKDTESNKSPVKKKNKIPVDVRSFSDTFDVLSETGEIEESTSAVPLFADLEPSHFTKPARHSYKRKRAVRFSFSEESSEDEDIHVPQTKRKKAGALSKQDEKRLKEWINNVNHTFEEIDQYDLVVE